MQCLHRMLRDIDSRKRTCKVMLVPLRASTALPLIAAQITELMAAPTPLYVSITQLK